MAIKDSGPSRPTMHGRSNEVKRNDWSYSPFDGFSLGKWLSNKKDPFGLT